MWLTQSTLTCGIAPQDDVAHRHSPLAIVVHDEWRSDGRDHPRVR